MTPLNLLQQYMDFFKQNHIGGPRGGYGNPNGFNPTPYNEDAAAASWAERMLGGGMNGGTQNRMPDYFGGEPQRYQPSYTPPAFTPPQQPAPAGFFSPQPLTGQVNNMLANYLRGR